MVQLKIFKLYDGVKVIPRPVEAVLGFLNLDLFWGYAVLSCGAGPRAVRLSACSARDPQDKQLIHFKLLSTLIAVWFLTAVRSPINDLGCSAPPPFLK